MAMGNHTPRSSDAPLTSSKATLCHGTREEDSRSRGMKQRNASWTVTAGETVNLNEEEEEREERNDSVSQLTSLESARQSIPPLSFKLAGPASTSLSIPSNTKLSTVLKHFNETISHSHQMRQIWWFMRCRSLKLTVSTLPSWMPCNFSTF